MAWAAINGMHHYHVSSVVTILIHISRRNTRLIWAICGTGFLLDVMWAQAFGLAASNIQREFGFSDQEFGNIAAAFSAGITAGAFVWGVLVDVVGSLPIWTSLLYAPIVLRV